MSHFLGMISTNLPHPNFLESISEGGLFQLPGIFLDLHKCFGDMYLLTIEVRLKLRWLRLMPGTQELGLILYFSLSAPTLWGRSLLSQVTSRSLPVTLPAMMDSDLNSSGNGHWLWSRSWQNNCTAFVVHIRSFHFIVSFWEGRSLHSYRIWNLERIKSVFNPCNEKVILSFSFREGQQPVFQLPLPLSPQPIAHTVKVTSIGSTHIIRSFTTPIAFGGVTKLPG